MDPFEDFLNAVRNSMATYAAQQVVLPIDILSPAAALSAKFYSGVPTASLREYLQRAEEQENYELCALIQLELEKRQD